jgi:hypothetical protein
MMMSAPKSACFLFLFYVVEKFKIFILTASRKERPINVVVMPEKMLCYFNPFPFPFPPIRIP